MRNWPMVVLAAALSAPVYAIAGGPPPESTEARQEAERLNALPPVAPPNTVHIDRSGRKEAGGGSFYAQRFARRKMADGRPMDPDTNIAASKSLPLGSVAKVTNLDNGKTATVKIEDRGPYVDGRVVDLAPKVAAELDMKTKGVAPVEVAPVTVPEPDGSVKLGAGAAEASPREIQDAVSVTRQLMTPRETETAGR